MRLRRLPHLVLIALLASTAGCAADAEAENAVKVSVTATDDSCDLDRTDLPAGVTTFAVTNRGTKVTGVYVYGQDGDAFTKVISEVENIGPGTSRDLVVNLSGGAYEVTCKPGQRGDGIRTKIRVVGDTGPTPADDDSFDRKIELTTDGTTIQGDFAGAKVGERIEFELENTSATPVILELKDESGTVAGETSEIQIGQTGEIIVLIASPGTWSVIVEATGKDDIKASLKVA